MTTTYLQFLQDFPQMANVIHTSQGASTNMEVANLETCMGGATGSTAGKTNKKIKHQILKK